VSESTVVPSQRWWLHRGPWIGVGLAVAILLFGAWLRRHTLDDSFINYRIVRQLQAGNGPVFNAGERVEAFTSPLWLAMLVVGDAVLPFDLEWIGMVGGMLLGALGLIFAALGARHLHRVATEGGSDRNVLIPLGALVLAVFPPIYRLIATGLEDGLTVAWLGASVWVLGRWATTDRRFGLPSAFLIGLGVLVRPDLAPFCAVFLLAVLIGDRGHGWRRGTLMVVSAVALPVATEVLRMGYFGVLTPNTAIAKSAHLTRWGRGWDYLLGTMNPYWFWIPVAVLVVVGYVPLLRRFGTPGRSLPDLRRALVTAAFAVGSLACTLYIVRLGGDYMQTRLLLPAVFGFVAPVTLVNWRIRRRLDIGVALTAVALVWLVVCGLFLRTPSDDRAVLFEPQNAVTLEDFAAVFPGPIAPATTPGSVFYMAKRLPYASSRGATPVIVELGVGKVGYAIADDVYLLDGLGLANPISAHEKLLKRGWPGHEKLLTQPWMAALATAPGSPVRASDFPHPPTLMNGDERVVIPQQDDPQGREFSERVATARAVLSCDTMARFRASYEAPLTWRRFGSNLVRSFAHQRLEISGEPADAAADLCTPAERRTIPGVGHPAD
jgi:arabinofuranosyltransferase